MGEEFVHVVKREPDWMLMGGATLDAQRFCRQMLHQLESSRPTARKALKDRWFEVTGVVEPERSAFDALDKTQIRNLLSVGERSSFEKFVSRLVATQVDASQQRQANQAFRAFDTDGDGMLSRSELRAGLKALGASPTHIEQIVNELDIGRTGQISY